MSILPAGTFKVGEKRKAIPNRVKLAVLARDFDVDHDPALVNRDYDTEAEDFCPRQHDPDFLRLRPRAAHDEKTFGRKAGAAKTVTTRGSDVGEAARTRAIRAREAVHQATIASKAGDYEAATEILASVRKPKAKQPIPARPSAWPKGRKLKSRGFNPRRKP